MSSIAHKEAQKRYDKKVKRILVKYSIQELEEYRKIETHCKELGITYQKYVKALIQEDMKKWTTNNK